MPNPIKIQFNQQFSIYCEFKPNKSTILDYQLVQVLGSGSFSVIWLAKNKKSSDVYAIKIINKKKLLLENAQENLISEVEIMKKLKGKFGVLQLYEAFSSFNYSFMLLEHSELGTLQDLFKGMGPFKFTEVSYYLVQITTGLHSLHSSKIIY
ncbi:hypothetical protein CROQUDRAFT_136376 [Cronartium quercuum f. sp. fusiforme G11]|uniref:non-specific serine/threonine protein kinase n=1 Tax=Cronartium quercuum f. sp. fusiforme G11 TaxID=708437 RepID=A0A9P6N722_9BASI|nr:hypothetical protein CROQUDRAFT_136376 [Cronartium quercuum f. sp. fusiforme G11]